MESRFDAYGESEREKERRGRGKGKRGQQRDERAKIRDLVEFGLEVALVLAQVRNLGLGPLERRLHLAELFLNTAVSLLQFADFTYKPSLRTSTTLRQLLPVGAIATPLHVSLHQATPCDTMSYNTRTTQHHAPPNNTITTSLPPHTAPPTFSAGSTARL
jgi:hypothetical protein